MSEEATLAEESLEIVEPIIVDLGKKRRKQIKRLKKGQGKLWQEVIDVVDEIGGQISGDNSEGKTIVPVILVYKEKQKKSRSIFPRF